jgi:hypothetical protein
MVGPTGAGTSSASRGGGDASAGSFPVGRGRSTSGHDATPARARRELHGRRVRTAPARPALQDLELLAQDEDLDILRTITTSAQDEQVDHESDKTVVTGHPPILIDADRAVHEDRRKPQVNRHGRVSGTHTQGRLGCLSESIPNLV